MPRDDKKKSRSVEDFITASDETLTGSHRHRIQRESIESFLRNIFFPNSQPFRPSITEDLLETLSPLWETTILPTLLLTFGKGSTLYAIFYTTGAPENEVILEVWDPNYVDTKPSETFRFRGISNIAKQLPRSRSKAKIITIKNWE